MKIKIVSDGTHKNTHVMTESGEKIDGVMSASWFADGDGQRIELVLFRADIEVLAGASITDLQEISKTGETFHPTPRPGMLHGEPLRLTAEEWVRIPKLEQASGMASFGYAVGLFVAEANQARDPDAPLMTHDEYLRSVA